MTAVDMDCDYFLRIRIHCRVTCDEFTKLENSLPAVTREESTTNCIMFLLAVSYCDVCEHFQRHWRLIVRLAPTTSAVPRNAHHETVLENLL